jgi:5-methylthioribose kinase
MIRRILGLAHVADRDEIADPTARALSETRALHAARELLVNRSKYANMAGLLDMIREQRGRTFT